MDLLLVVMLRIHGGSPMGFILIATMLRASGQKKQRPDLAWANPLRRCMAETGPPAI